MLMKQFQVAVKLESVKARHPQLLYESKLYKILQVGFIHKDTEVILFCFFVKCFFLLFKLLLVEDSLLHHVSSREE